MVRDADRFPVSTYEQAKRWLFTFSQVEEWAFDPDAELPREALLVCDTFWLSASQLCADLRRDWREALAPDRPRPRHELRQWGWLG